MPTKTTSKLFGEESAVQRDSVSFVTRFVASKVTFHSFSTFLSFCFFICLFAARYVFSTEHNTTSHLDHCFDHNLINIFMFLTLRVRTHPYAHLLTRLRTSVLKSAHLYERKLFDALTPSLSLTHTRTSKSSFVLLSL